jgi:DNA-binding MarR family transcriptional regulator
MELSYKLRELGSAFEALSKATAPHIGLNKTDMQALDLVVRTGGLTAGQLAERLCVTTAAMTAVLDRLERSHLAIRVEDSEDRRRVVVRPTARARRGCGLLVSFQSDLFAILARYSESELAALEDFMDAVALGMSKRTAELREGRESL